MRGPITSTENPPDDEAGWENRRKHKRKPVLWAARVETPQGDFDCIALDLSLGGAKLRLAAPLDLHQTVTLVVDRFGALGAEVVWRRSGQVGLRFTGDPTEIARILGNSLPL